MALSGLDIFKLEDETGWPILAGPREAGVIPRYLQELWSAPAK
jgi:CO dehydrogenase/acetyl-CoA synthase gamma subunit (corrinoid Fe-S protein)